MFLVSCSECGKELVFEPDVFAKQCPCCGNIQMRTAEGQNPGPVPQRKKAKRGKIIAIIAAICVVVAVGGNDYGQCNVNGWTGIVAISAGNWHTVVLKENGTVVAVGDNPDDRCNVTDWKNIKLPNK